MPGFFSHGADDTLSRVSSVFDSVICTSMNDTSTLIREEIISMIFMPNLLTCESKVKDTAVKYLQQMTAC